MKQDGVEVEWRWFPSNSVVVYGNYAYAHSKYRNQWVMYDSQPVLSLIDDLYTDDSLVMAGAPEQTWNLGVDWDINDDIALNLHYRGRYGVLSIFPNESWETYGSEHFFDANLRWREALGEESEVSFYMKNIGDNRGLFPTGYGVIETQLGREVGVKVTVGF